MYKVENSNLEVIGNFSSVKSAHEAVQQFFQNGTEESISEIRSSIRSFGSAVVTDITFGQTCWIEKV